MESNLVQRYQEYRRISGEIQSAALEMVPGAAMIDFGRRLGALRHGKVALEDPNDLKLLYEIAVHTAKPGRTRALDRYANKTSFPAGSDDARMLHGLQTAYFTLFEIRRRHKVAGAVAWDVPRKQEFHLMDVSIGLSADAGACYVGRMMDIDGFSMSCVTVLPVDAELVEEALPFLPPISDDTTFADMQDPRCAIAFYRAAIASGQTAWFLHHDVAKQLPTEAMMAAIRAANGRPPVDWLAPLAVR